MSLLDRAFAATYDWMLAPVEKRGLAELRERLLRPLTGKVVEIGAGTGLNLSHYSSAVTELTLVEPSEEMAARLRDRVARLWPKAHVLVASAEALPLPDGSADAVVSTLVLCTVGDPAQAAQELRRVLRPGGTLVLLEHVHAPGGWGRAQRALEPFTRLLGRGCHLTRDTRATLAQAGFDVSAVEERRLPGMPRLFRAGIVGQARGGA
jgi:ubiquinone/menaquinone biosynthesis C-methylase UbiE